MSNIWVPLEIENKLKSSLISEFNTSLGDSRFGHYTNVRTYLLDNIYEQIKGTQPDLTDHGPGHIQNVLDNINDLLGDQNKDLNCMELNVLCLSVLFHDVGNIFDRYEHQKNIREVYDQACPNINGSDKHEEKLIILDICKAHCGESISGDNDTIRNLKETSKLERKVIRLKILAAILRFADELAEGPQRTSWFMMKKHMYSEKSNIFHKYASCSKVDIDRLNGRICLVYHISIDLGDESDKSSKDALVSIDELEAFLGFIYKRIEKLNQERQYAKHYSSILFPFKETSASFNFWYNGQQIPVDLDPVILSDLVVPGDDPQKTIVERYKQYKETDLKEVLIKEISSIQ